MSKQPSLKRASAALNQAVTQAFPNYKYEGKTHYPECYRSHPVCAFLLAWDMQQEEIDRLVTERDRYKQAPEQANNPDCLCDGGGSITHEYDSETCTVRRDS